MACKIYMDDPDNKLKDSSMCLGGDLFWVDLILYTSRATLNAYPIPVLCFVYYTTSNPDKHYYSAKKGVAFISIDKNNQRTVQKLRNKLN